MISLVIDLPPHLTQRINEGIGIIKRLTYLIAPVKILVDFYIFVFCQVPDTAVPILSLFLTVQQSYLFPEVVF